MALAMKASAEIACIRVDPVITRVSAGRSSAHPSSTTADTTSMAHVDIRAICAIPWRAVDVAAGAAGGCAFMDGIFAESLREWRSRGLFGLLDDASHGWGLPFGFLALCALVIGAGSWQACRERMQEDQAS